MILIADCGSTKTDWCVLDKTKVAKQIFTCGMNAVMLTEEEIQSRIRAELLPDLGDLSGRLTHVYFYGAGCISPEVCGNVAGAIKAELPSVSSVEVYSDLVAAARSLCGNEPGIACILGTGSNSCFYDGKGVVDNVSPLGYILGDEGSGAVLGKLFIGDVLKKQMPSELCARFLSEYQLDMYSIIRKVYREPQPNRFLASVTPFMSRNIDVPEVHSLVLGAFRSFFRRNIANYADYREYPVNFIGSIAYHFRCVLAEAAAAEGCSLGKIVKSPMDGLVKFHSCN